MDRGARRATVHGITKSWMLQRVNKHSVAQLLGETILGNTRREGENEVEKGHRSPALQADSLPSEPPGKPLVICCYRTNHPALRGSEQQ